MKNPQMEVPTSEEIQNRRFLFKYARWSIEEFNLGE